MRLRSVASLVLVALDRGRDRRARRQRQRSAARAAPVRVIAAPAASRPFVDRAPLAYACAAPVPVDPSGKPQAPPPQTPKAPTAAPPSQQLLDAFAILRRPRTDQDALSPEALEALRVRGLSPVSLDSARLLRSTPSGGKAWVVPVPDVVGRLGRALRARGQVGFARGRRRRGDRRCRERRGRGARRPRARPRARDRRPVRGRRPLDALDLGDRAQRRAGRLPHRPRRHRGARRRQGQRLRVPASQPALRTSSATSCGPGETGRPTSSRSSPSPRGGRARASPPPS